jgi:hypothetical protein
VKSHIVLISLIAAHAWAAEVINVSDRDSLRAALGKLGPGVTVKLAVGEYGGGYGVDGASGTAAEPIVIEAADPRQPPRFTGGGLAIHFKGCSYLTVRHLHVKGQTGNGLNLDDGGAKSHHVTLEHLKIEEIGPEGNRDAIKLSGLTDFAVRDCEINGWAGQAIDMVGCQRGVLERCRFEGKEGFSQGTGPQTKGGSADIVIRGCTFINAGQRPLNVGGSTGRPYFRPADAMYEARRITVERCLIIGGLTGIAFASAQECVARYNTIVNPQNWAIRILQDNQEPGMVVCGNNRFEHNIVSVTKGSLREWVNVGTGTAAETFIFTGNWWYQQGARNPRPKLPAPEEGGIYGVDPALDEAAGYRPRANAADKAGHLAE